MSLTQAIEQALSDEWARATHKLVCEIESLRAQTEIYRLAVETLAWKVSQLELELSKGENDD